MRHLRAVSKLPVRAAQETVMVSQVLIFLQAMLMALADLLAAKEGDS